MGKFERHCGMRKHPDELSNIIVVVKIFGINNSLWLCPRQLQPLIGAGIQKNNICAPYMF